MNQKFLKNMNSNIKWVSLAIAGLVALPGISEENKTTNPNSNGKSPAGHLKVAATCQPASAQTDLDINNVRTKILNGGDMWWDLANQKYEIPKGSNLHSLFAGALWIGGLDEGGQLKLAGMTYRQTGSDFFPGPLDLATNTITNEECSKYDKHWKIHREEVQRFLDTYGSGDPVPGSILTWPGNGNSNQTQFLAPFNDVNGDGVYDPSGSGDYPNYDLTGTASCNSCNDGLGAIDPDYKDILFGDQSLWWVFNDVGNIHSESGAQAIGLEIQAQAFAFSTNDEINNMTFYKYKIINRSTYSLNNTYFGQWVDADVGNAFDDYVGCDVERGFGYAFNGDAYDESTADQNGYGFNPPAIGVDFFQGPLADKQDGIDNDRDCEVDESCEQIIMSKFVYYNNDNTIRGNPATGTHFYNYLKGIWKDGSKIVYGANGHSSGGGSVECDFMFPGDSDHEYEFGTGGTCASPGGLQPDWDEKGAGFDPADRRFLQSAGPFTLQPGAVNYITTGVVWTRAASGDNYSALPSLRTIDDKAQALFDNCFKVPNGPDAPDVSIREMDNELILSWTNKQSSNNFLEKYEELDPTIQNLHYEWIDNGTLRDTDIVTDKEYRFQGYIVYQLKDASVTITDIADENKARVAFVCDKRDAVTKLINYNFDGELESSVPVLGVDGPNKGIVHSITIKDDLFAAGNTKLVNHKKYYYTVIAYGYNEFKKYKQDQVVDPLRPLDPDKDGQKKPFFPGRRNIKTYSGTPQNPLANNYGQIVQAKYGDSPRLRRVEGKGNGGNFLDFTSATVREIMESGSHRSLHPVYEKTGGPVSIKVYDPVAVPYGDFTFKLLVGDTNKAGLDSARWVLINQTTGEAVFSETTISDPNEQLIPQWGLAVSTQQALPPGPTGDFETNGFVGDTMLVESIELDWLTGVPDVDGFTPQINWIRSGTTYDQSAQANNDFYYPDVNPPGGFDENQVYEKVILKTVRVRPEFEFELAGGTWAPYRLCAYKMENPIPGGSVVNTGPAWNSAHPLGSTILPPVVMRENIGFNESDNLKIAGNRMKDLQSVDVVFTSDITKWSRAMVLEAQDDSLLAYGKVRKLDPRSGASVGKDGKPDGTGYGMGWFPGYAYSLETGERLNIMYAEDSYYPKENGRDMIWNPTENMVDENFNPRVGGTHYVYVMLSLYDECARYNQLLTSKVDSNKVRVFKEAGWVTIPLVKKSEFRVQPGELFTPPGEVVVKLRVSRPYELYNTSPEPENRNVPMYSFNTGDLYAIKNSRAAAKGVLDIINVVPNPYYAYSAYEATNLDNLVKITNLPSRCLISIYSVNGNLIRQFDRDIGADVSLGASTDKINLETAQEWDLKNEAGTPVSSGVYLIHIKVDGIGERVVKWFGVMRPIDLDSY